MWKSRSVYAALVVVSFIFSQALYEPISFMTFLIVIILPFVSLLLALISYPLVVIKVYTSAAEIKRFDKFTVRIGVYNRSPFISPRLLIKCSLPDDEGIDIRPVVFSVNASVGNGGTFDYTRFFANRGKYTVTVDSVEFCDFLRLVKFKKSINKYAEVLSGPRNIQLLMPITAEQQQHDNSTIVGTSVVLSGGDMAGVREYAYGDNLKNVHWKLSAKSDGLIMKSFAEDIYDHALVIVDMSAYYGDLFKNRSMTDCVVEAALYVARTYARESVRFSILINTGKNDVMRIHVASPSDMHGAEKAVSAASLLENTSILDLLRTIDAETLTGSEVCIISSFGTDDVQKSIKKIFINSKNKLNIVRISETELPEKAGEISFTRSYIENLSREDAR